MDELKEKMIEAEKLLEERDSEVKSLREQIDEISDNNPDYVRFLINDSELYFSTEDYC